MVRVLVIDDDRSIREILSYTLSDEGYEVEEAPGGQVALDLIGLRHPHIILLDMKMPKMDGWEFVKQYRERYGHRAPIIVLTAARDAARRGAEVNAESTIAKPFDLEVLLERVASFASELDAEARGAAGE